MPFVPGKRYRIRQLDGTMATLVKGAPKSSIVKKAVRRARNTAFSKKVMKVVNRKQETKYVAENITIVPGGPASFQVPSFQTTPANLSRMIPNLTQGVGEHQRIGDVVQPTRCTGIWTLYLGLTDVFDVTLNILIVTVKGASQQAALPNLPVGQLLKVGDGTNTDPVGFTPIEFLTLVNNYKVNSDQYTQLKWIKRRFAKGPGAINLAAPGTLGPPVAGQGPAVIKYTWKPPKLKYGDAADVLPSNHYPCYLIWATANDGSALTGGLSFNYRSELSYKDA